ncbi:DUF1552 domain-containing protein [Allorhodopirellula heiligendammensis]|uniref:DUF1552 domain-containing protein n=1 Tax=Allorhodopirellula heiligendammensis TaxID=2714739 RepID=A0A5C6C1X2_9BACT|nr:DUF1552 domain-containing protein [Allorhodopirellula heiligendammensis]TWU18085.1 hypothetical protein Poly21_02400 [Allorhodopirellula heiligendammensis]
MRPLSRRSVLRGLGTCLSLPLLDAMVPTAQAAASKFKSLGQSLHRQPRMICCYVPNGVNILQWQPETTGEDYQLSPTLQALNNHRDEFTVLSGLGHPSARGGHSGADTWLTAADLNATPGSDYTNWVSADQIVANHHASDTRFGSLQLSDRSGTGAAGHSNTLSFGRGGTPLPAESSPQRLFERLFVPDSAGDRQATLQRYADRKSILDNVLGEARTLQKSLSSPDRQKLEEYLHSVRETERSVARSQAWIDVPRAKVDSKHLLLASQPHDAHDRSMWLDVMLELSYLAFVTDSTRVITYQWSREASGYGGGGENHHELSHHGGDPGMLKKLGVIDRFHLSRLSRFLDLLKQTGDGEGTMLDHTMVLYGSGMNSGLGGGHSPKNLPLLLAGGRGLGIKHGRHIGHDEDKHPPLSNLLLSLMQKMGVESDSFADATGTLTI